MNEKQARDLVYARSDGVCERCGVERAQEWHHRKNRSQAGQWSPSNGLHLDPWCHRWVTEHPNDAVEHGWSVRSWQDPAVTPVVIRGRWFLLDDAGGCTAVPDSSPEEVAA